MGALWKLGPFTPVRVRWAPLKSATGSDCPFKARAAGGESRGPAPVGVRRPPRPRRPRAPPPPPLPPPPHAPPPRQRGPGGRGAGSGLLAPFHSFPLSQASSRLCQSYFYVLRNFQVSTRAVAPSPCRAWALKKFPGLFIARVYFYSSPELEPLEVV